MTAYLISSHVFTTADYDHAVDLTGTDNVYVFEGVTVAATGDNANGIYAGSGTHTVAVYGGVISDLDYAIQLFGINHDVFIADTGSVHGESGLYINSGSNVDVQGSIKAAQGAGILIQAGENYINIGSTGTLASAGSAIIINGFYGGTNSKVVNSGAITTTGNQFSHGINISSEAGQENLVVNFGLISATGHGIDGERGNETVINRGMIEGDVALGAGADVYKGQGGVVLGDILGGSGSDLLVGGEAEDVLLGGAGNDTLKGKAGEDLLNGGADVDLLIGGSGGDTFEFKAVTDSGVAAAARDRLADFQQGFDLIDLSSIDADSTLAGNQAFTYIGSDGFSVPGQVRVVQGSATTVVLLSHDADLGAEMAINLTGAFALSAEDFVL